MDIILGTSAEERSKLIYEKAALLSEDENKQIIIIVPEQYTLETQKGIVKAHPRHAIMNIDVVSFNRLAYKVLDATGSQNLPMIRETGKNMIVRKALNRIGKKLKYFSSGMKKRGFVSEMKSLLSELDQYAATPDSLEKISASLANGAKRNVSDKISDIACIFREYKNQLESRFYTCEDLLSALEKRLADSSFLTDSYVFFDGFTGFTLSQYKIIETIIKKAQSTCFSFCYEGIQLHPESTAADSGNLFFMTDTAVKKLSSFNALYESSGINFIYTDSQEQENNVRAFELEFLRHSFFLDPIRTKKTERPVFKGKVEAISISEADDVKEEIGLVIGNIRRLITEEGYRYRDIAVVMEDIESYGDLTYKLMEQNGFPVFLDRIKNVSVNPFIENIRAFLKLITDGLSYENMFRYIKCGFSPIGDVATDELDNYCLATGIRSEAKWKMQWQRITGRLKTNEEGEHEPYYDLELLNEYRLLIYTHILLYRDKLNKAVGVSEKISVLTELLDEAFVSERTRRLLESSIGEETRQTVRKTAEIFRETVLLFGDEKMSTQELSEMLDSAFEEISAGFIPPSNDCIIIGDTDRTRLQNIRALFIVGVNDGIIPKKNTSGGILSDSDRLRLSGAGLTLAPSVREQAFIQKFYLYLLLTKPFEKLYLSYSRRDLGGGALIESYLIKDLLEAFEGLMIEPAGETEICLSRLGLVQSPRVWTSEAGEILLSEDAASAVYNGEVSGSISSFESFAGCPFTYFLKKGLNIYPRERYEFNPADFGTIVHDILYRVLKGCTDKKIRIDLLSTKQADALVEEGLKQAEGDYYILSDSERNRFIRYRIKQITSATLKAVGYQLAGGEFVPHAFEKRFSSTHEVTGGRLKFSGVIDRSDISISGNEIYLRIVDYKTGQNDFNLNSFYHGRQLQLVSYLNASCEELEALYPDKNIIPSAMLYMTAKNPFAVEDETKLSDKEIEEQIADSFRMNGLVVDDDLSVIKNDNEGRGNIIKDVRFKDGKLMSLPAHSRLDRDQMVLLRKYAVKKTSDIAEKILAGVASISPLEEPESNRRSVCAFCNYMSICNYTAEFDKIKRSIIKCKNEELWEKISDDLSKSE